MDGHIFLWTNQKKILIFRPILTEGDIARITILSGFGVLIKKNKETCRFVISSSILFQQHRNDVTLSAPGSHLFLSGGISWFQRGYPAWRGLELTSLCMRHTMMILPALRTPNQQNRCLNSKTLRNKQACTYLTLIKGLKVNSSAKVEGMVGSPFSFLSYRKQMDGEIHLYAFTIWRNAIPPHTFAQASFFLMTSLSGSTCRANFRLLMVYSWPQ